MAFLYNNKHTEIEIVDTCPFTVASKNKILGINLTKNVKNLYTGLLYLE